MRPPSGAVTFVYERSISARCAWAFDASTAASAARWTTTAVSYSWREMAFFATSGS